MARTATVLLLLSLALASTTSARVLLAAGNGNGNGNGNTGKRNGELLEFHRLLLPTGGRPPSQAGEPCCKVSGAALASSNLMI